MLEGGALPTTQLALKVERVKSLALKAMSRKRAVKFGISKVESKRDFDQLLNYELFDYERHDKHDDDLLRMFLSSV